MKEWNLDIDEILASPRRVHGKFHTPKVDKDNEYIHPDAVANAVPDFMHLPILHDFHKERPIGIATRVVQLEDGSFDFDGVIKNTADCNDIWDKIQSKNYNQVSLFGSRLAGSESCKVPPGARVSPCMSTAIRLDSISACDENARNDGTSLEVVKAGKVVFDAIASIKKAETTDSSLIHTVTDYPKGSKRQPQTVREWAQAYHKKNPRDGFTRDCVAPMVGKAMPVDVKLSQEPSWMNSGTQFHEEMVGKPRHATPKVKPKYYPDRKLQISNVPGQIRSGVPGLERVNMKNIEDRIERLGKALEKALQGRERRDNPAAPHREGENPGHYFERRAEEGHRRKEGLAGLKTMTEEKGDRPLSQEPLPRAQPKDRLKEFMEGRTDAAPIPQYPRDELKGDHNDMNDEAEDIEAKIYRLTQIVEHMVGMDQEEEKGPMRPGGPLYERPDSPATETGNGVKRDWGNYQEHPSATTNEQKCPCPKARLPEEEKAKMAEDPNGGKTALNKPFQHREALDKAGEIEEPEQKAEMKVKVPPNKKSTFKEHEEREKKKSGSTEEKAITPPEEQERLARQHFEGKRIAQEPGANFDEKRQAHEGRIQRQKEEYTHQFDQHSARPDSATLNAKAGSLQEDAQPAIDQQQMGADEESPAEEQNEMPSIEQKLTRLLDAVERLVGSDAELHEKMDEKARPRITEEPIPEGTFVYSTQASDGVSLPGGAEYNPDRPVPDRSLQRVLESRGGSVRKGGTDDMKDEDVDKLVKAKVDDITKAFSAQLDEISKTMKDMALRLEKVENEPIQKSAVQPVMIIEQAAVEAPSNALAVANATKKQAGKA